MHAQTNTSRNARLLIQHTLQKFEAVRCKRVVAEWDQSWRLLTYLKTCSSVSTLSRRARAWGGTLARLLSAAALRAISAAGTMAHAAHELVHSTTNPHTARSPSAFGLRMQSLLSLSLSLSLSLPLSRSLSLSLSPSLSHSLSGRQRSARST